jgi:multidrug efflux pump subunit AcrB
MVDHALRRPVTVLMAVIAVALAAGLALARIPVDVFPRLNLPVIYVAQPYGGMDPAQMEGFLVSYYEYHFLYIGGIEHVESKSVQNMGLIKLQFHPGTDMAQALAQTVSYVERARAFMPPGTVAPFVVRFDTGSVPVGQLVFSSDSRPVSEIQDLALFRVRPMLATLPGVSAPPPFGSSQRTVVIRVDPQRLRAHGLAPDDVVRAVAAGNAILPSGNVRIGDISYLAPVNSVVTDISELLRLPLRLGAGPSVFLRDVGSVENAADILTGYASVNGRRTVYVPVTKQADASTLDVVRRLRHALPAMQAAIPDDIKVTYELDQSNVVVGALRSLLWEGLAGAVLAGLMILFFLRDGRSAAIVVVTIPLALLAAALGLWVTGHTLNLMTLGGFALAVGILVDEATVAIENIHAHRALGDSLLASVRDGIRETSAPRLLAMLAVLAVFAPSVFMSGIARAMFIPLALAVGIAVVASYLLSSLLVPVLAAWWMPREQSIGDGAVGDRLRSLLERLLAGAMTRRGPIVAVYMAACAAAIALSLYGAGLDLFPESGSRQFQLRIRAPAGTRVERTEVIADQVLEQIRIEVGRENIEVTLGFVGAQPPNFPVNSIFLWTSGPQDAVLRVALKPDTAIDLPALEERLRARLAAALPGVEFSFEAGDIVGQILSLGAPTPIEIAVSGPNMAANREFAGRLLSRVRQDSHFRDVQFGQVLDYPTLEVQIDRERAAQLGFTVEQVGRSLAPVTSSSRYIAPIYWRDPQTGVGYQVQVELPQSTVGSAADLENIVLTGGASGARRVGDLSRLEFARMPGEVDRYNQRRTVSITATLAPGVDLGSAARAVTRAIAATGEPPRGVAVASRGQVPALEQTLTGLATGLALAVAAIAIALTATFQSLRTTAVVLCALPGALAGTLIALRVTGTTINIESFLGAIMAMGVCMANALLLGSFAERAWRIGADAASAARDAALRRLRPVLMTSAAMIAGMTPMALGLGAAGADTAPLARAVIGGLLGSTPAVLIVVPLAFAIWRGSTSRRNASLHPDDELVAAA